MNVGIPTARAWRRIDSLAPVLACVPKPSGKVRARRNPRCGSGVQLARDLFGTGIAQGAVGELAMMSLVRLLGFTTLACGCVTGHYREVATNREVTYVEEKGTTCSEHAHRRNHTLAPVRFGVTTLNVTAKAS
jgi:hypothetical protein